MDLAKKLEAIRGTKRFNSVNITDLVSAIKFHNTGLQKSKTMVQVSKRATALVAYVQCQ